MDRERYSRIAHGELPVWNPVPLEVLVDFATRACLASELSARLRVLDIGCGRARLLHELATRVRLPAGLQVVGLDSSKLAIEAALADRPRLRPDVSLELRREPFRATSFEAGSFGLVCCLGSLHAVGDFETALEVLAALVQPTGHLLLGAGYWRREPSQAYLDALGGGQRDELGTREENLAQLRARGWRVLDEHCATREEWDHYEGSYAANVERHLASCPDDPDAEAMRARMTAWREAYRDHGRDTLGFAAYLCLRGQGRG